MPHPDSIPFRPRRLRRSTQARRLLARTHLQPADLVAPVFVTDAARKAVPSMPGVDQLPVPDAADFLDALAEKGVGAYLAFGVISSSQKDAAGSPALDPDNVVCKLLRETRRRKNPMLAVTDLCFCEYTSHGHCGPLTETNELDNDATLPLLARQAVNHAAAGADWVAPSGCVDGMVAAVRRGLDDANYPDVAVMSYAVKYASAFYGPFRDAADSAPAFGDRRGYQMDPARGPDEALAEARRDVAEGADLVMVKPAGPYLDVLAAVRRHVRVPVAAYQVSGEYAMLKAAVDAGHLAETAILESLLAVKRAGADLIVTYFTPWLADRL